MKDIVFILERNAWLQAPSGMDLARIDLNLLVALDRLLAYGSVTRAAASLGVGQPALSKSLEKLRELLGDELLVRSGRTLVKTARATELQPRVRAALEAVFQALQPVAPFEPRSARGTLRVALGDDVQSALLVPLALLLTKEAPGLELRVRPLTLELPAALERDAVDLAVVPDLRQLPGSPVPDLSRFVAKKLYRERFVVASRSARRFSLRSFAAAEHVLVAPTGVNDVGFVDTLLAERGLTRRIAVTVPTFHQAVELVAQSDLIATLPDRALRVSPRPVHTCAAPLPLPALDALIVWHPRYTTDARHRFVRELLRRALQRPESQPAGSSTATS
jgi:DNA-binding transcriptional LysR family regulator